MKRRLITALLKYQWLNERAYLGNFIANIASTVFYTLAFIIFVHLLFQRIGSLAGYSRNDMLLLFFMGQVGFFTTWQFIMEPFSKLVQQLNTGEFDFVLVRPVPLKSWVTAQAVGPLSLVLEIGPPLVIAGLFVKWSWLHITFLHLLAATFIWLASMALCYLAVLLLAIPAFISGESSELLHVFWGMGPQSIPFEKIPVAMKFAAFSILPTVMYTSVVTAVLLGKVTIIPTLCLAAVAGLLALLGQRLVWKYALKSYTSASS